MESLRPSTGPRDRSSPGNSQSGGALRVVIVLLLVLAAIGATLPPFFTNGKCTAEFEARSAEAESLRSQLATLEQAEAYLAAHALPFAEISAEQCERSPPPGVEVCADGPLLLTALPVGNRICSWYRDDKVRVQLLYGRSLQLRRMQTDMKPYKKLQMRLLGIEIDWAR